MEVLKDMQHYNGSCLFNSVSIILFGDESKSVELKSMNCTGNNKMVLCLDHAGIGNSH